MTTYLGQVEPRAASAPLRQAGAPETRPRMPDDQNFSILLHLADNCHPLCSSQDIEKRHSTTLYGHIARMVQPTGMLGEGAILPYINLVEYQS